VFLPFDTWALAVLIGLNALGGTLIGRPDDAIFPDPRASHADVAARRLT
jgi:hypothetical protein